jgi:type II secretory pathway pseudopilin PulG
VVVISILTLIILIPSIFLTIRKWKEEKLKENANSYIQKIQEKYPEIAVIKHETSIENDKNFLDITILNDKKFLDQNKLHKANDINKNIHLRWHYSSNSELKFLQNQIDELRKKLETKEKIK